MKANQSVAYMFLWGDLVTLLIPFIISIYFLNESHLMYSEWGFFIFVSILWGSLGYFRITFFPDTTRDFISRVFSFATSYFIWVVFVTLIYFSLNFPLDFSNIIIALFLGVLIMGVTTNIFINIVLAFVHRKRKNVVYTLVAGVGDLAHNVERQLTTHYDKNRQIRGFVRSRKETPVISEEKVIGNVKDIDQYLQDNEVDEIVIAVPLKTSKKVKKIMDIADYHGVRVKYVVDYQGTFGRPCKPVRYGDIEALNVRQFPLDEKVYWFMKNAFDFLFSLVALVGLSFAFIIIGILIKLDSPGPVFYCPTRIGKGGRPIKIYKFRTMVENDTSGVLSTAKDDPRVTKIGKLLRKYSIDELPQFINVLLGDMSVVGPRPHRVLLNKQFQQSEQNYMIRHYYKPGITGWAQVNGWRGPTETKEQRQKRTEYDLWYLENWSLSLDFKIIWMTIVGRNTRLNAF